MKRISLLVFFLCTFSLSGCNFSLAADVTPPPGYQQQSAVIGQPETPTSQLFPLVPPNPAVGKEIFVEKCVPCHGESGLGDGPRSQDLPNPVIPIGSPEVARLVTPAQWFDVVSKGKLERFMPPFPSLTDRQKWDVVAYAISLSSHVEEITQAADLYQDNCAQCHGAKGEGDGQQAIGTVITDFTRQDFMAGKSAADFYKAISEGVSEGMPPFGDKLSEDQRWAMTSYIRNFSFVSSIADAPIGTAEPGTAQPTSELSFVPIVTQSMSDSLGTVSGIVMNGSGGVIPSGDEVTLHAFDQTQLVYTATTQIRSDGTYTFTNLNIGPGFSFLTTVDYAGVVYGSDYVTAQAQQTALDLPIQVYDSTDDVSILTADRLHYFFEILDEKTIRVVELYIISNPTNKTLVGSEIGQPIAKFSLPPGASSLEFQDGELGGRYVQTADGFGDTLPVRPGQGAYQVLFSYQMLFDRKLELKSKVTMDTRAVVILVPEASIKVKGPGIEDAGIRDVQGVQYHMYNGEAIKAGSQLDLTVTGRPTGISQSLSLGSNQNLVVGLGALGLVLVLAGVLLYSRSRVDHQSDLAQVPSARMVDENPETLMDAILALDDQYHEGELPEDAYLLRRGELKSRLKEWMDQQN